MAVEIIVPVSICVILPIAIVWIVFKSFTNKTNKQSEIILEAIKNNPNIDTDKLLDSFRNNTYTPWRSLNRKLLRGSIFTLLGIAFALIGVFCNHDEANILCWIACGVFGSIGIGFLIAYLFGYKHIDQLTAEQRK